jgi:tetratricopeptide (TPR) repeat protein
MSAKARIALIALALALAIAPSARAEESAAESSSRFGLEEIAEGFRHVERWHVDDARTVAERAYREHPDSALTLALVAEVKMHMSDYAGAVEFYDRAREAGAPDQLLSTAPLAKAALKATQGYEEFVGERFIVRYTPGKDAILVPYVLETLEKARDRVGGLLGWRPDARVIVEIYPTADTLAAVSTLTQKEIRDSGTIALCRWNRLMVTTPRAVYFGYAWRDTLAHELTHLIIGGASSNTVPIWLHEGIAKFAETAWRTDPGAGLSVEQQTAVREAAKKNKLIPFAKMHPSMAKLKSQDETSLAFAEVFTFIEFLVKRKGWEGMREALKAMAGGASDEEAIQLVHGKSLKGLEVEWKEMLKTREVKRGGEAPAADRKVLVKSTADAPEDQLHGVGKKGRRFARAADLLFARGRVKAAQKELEKASRETGSPLISAKLAMVAMTAGDYDAAEKAARQAIEGTPDLAGPNITLAEILVHRNKMEEAKVPLERALSVNPFDPRIYPLMLLVLGRDGDVEKRRHAELAQALLSADHAAAPPVILGHGGLVEVGALPFSRVYVHREGDETKRFSATGMVTPTAPIKIKPGRVEIRLVPPTGKPSQSTVTVLESQDGTTPQQISPSGEGS